MERIKVGLADFNPMLGDLVAGIVMNQPDMELSETYARCEDWLTGAGARPDVLLVETRASELPTACEKMMMEHPGLRIIAVGGDARRSYVYELSPRRIPLGEVSPQELTEVIRTVARPGASIAQPTPGQEH